jgi:GR25 family glycosyltransferase involved in LPS biosynthesis
MKRRLNSISPSRKPIFIKDRSKSSRFLHNRKSNAIANPRSIGRHLVKRSVDHLVPRSVDHLVPRSINIKQRNIGRLKPRLDIIHQQFSKEYEFKHVGWGKMPSTSIFDQTIDNSREWPKELGPVLVLSIRPERMKNFQTRMGPWMQYMRRFPATDGRLIDPQKWHRERKVVKKNMAPGRLGCYDTHVRIWETIAKSNYDVVTVLEDDVDFDYKNSVQLLTDFKKRFEDIRNTKWDFLAWGHGPWAFGKNTNIPGLKYWKRPKICQGFFSYTLTRTMAQKLVSQCKPFKNHAVDKWFYDEFIKQNHVNVLTCEPRMCWVVDVISDTNTKNMKK